MVLSGTGVPHNPKREELSKVKPEKLPFFKCGKELKGRVGINK